MYYRFGSKGDEVRKIQIALDLTPVDGIYGRMTEAAVKNYQIKVGMHPDGVVTPNLFNKLLDDDYSTDLRENRNDDLNIIKFWIPKEQYVNQITEKKYLFLHHTAGSHNPYNTIDIWSRDDRGRIATEFVIGGVSLTGDTKYDGEIVQAYPEGNWAFHLGNVNRFMQSHSVGIEICNYGFLTKKGNDFFTVYGGKVDPKYVTDLGYNFRGTRYYHSYSDAQIESCRRLIKYIQERDNIDITKGIKETLKKFDPAIAFDFFNDAVEGKIRGMLTHTNVRKDKSDIYPHPKMVEMLRNV